MKPPSRRLATQADAALLQGFSCARLGRYPQRDPEPWAQAIQGWIRGAAIREQAKQADRDLRVLIFDDPDTGDLVGVSAHVKWGPEQSGQRFILTVAVALPLRGFATSTGHTVAHHILRDTITDISDTEGGPVLVTSRVDPRNNPSRRLLARFGFSEGYPPTDTETLIDVVRAVHRS